MYIKIKQSVMNKIVLLFKIFFAIAYYISLLFASVHWYNDISFPGLMSVILYVLPSDDNSDSVTIKGVNEKINGVIQGFKNLSVLVGSGYVIKTVVGGIPHPTGKVVVGSVGLASLFAASHLERALRSSKKGPKNNFVSSNNFFGYEIPSEPNSEMINLCSWIGPFSAEIILILLIILFIEIFRKSLLKWIYETQSFKDWLNMFKHLIPTWLTNSTYKQLNPSLSFTSGSFVSCSY